jgi:hypothetical protein
MCKDDNQQNSNEILLEFEVRMTKDSKVYKSFSNKEYLESAVKQKGNGMLNENMEYHG